MIRFLFPESHESTLPLDVAKRIRPLILVDIILPVYFILAALLRYLNDVDRSRIFFLAVSLTSMVFVGSLVLVRFRHYRLASYLSSLGLILEVFWVGTLLPVDEASELYRFALYVGSAIIANGMISIHSWQIPSFMAASIGIYFIGTFTTYVPVLGGFSGDLLRNFLTTLTLIFTINYIVFIIDRTSKDLVKELKSYNETLEQRVKMRTQELADANLKLFARQEEIEKNLRLAQRIQLNILPNEHTYPKRKELTFSSTYKSLDTVGGDFFDVLRVGRNSYGFLIADVSGHGVAAAMVTTMAKVSFNTHANYGSSPGEICAQVNADIISLLGEERSHYLTAYLGILNLETGVFSYTNAGHHPALLIHPYQREITQLGNPNPFIGYFDDVSYQSEQVELKPGQRILLYTDGLVEAMNKHDELYDHPRLLRYADKNRHKSLKEFVDGLMEDVRQFCQGREPSDDQAVLMIEYRGKDNVEIQEAHRTGPQTDWKELIRVAVEHARNNRMVEAEELLGSIYSKWMDKPKVAHLYATLLYKVGKIEQARRVVEDALKISPDDQELLDLKKKVS